MKKSIFLALAFLVFSCHQPAKKYTQEEAEAQVLALPMVQEASKHIDKIAWNFVYYRRISYREKAILSDNSGLQLSCSF